VISLISPDGFPFSFRAPVSADESSGLIRIAGELTGVPLQPGLTCLTAHAHAEQFSWQQNFQVRGDLVLTEGSWAVVPRKVVGGFEMPRSRLAILRANASKVRRYRRTAKRELARRG
jgi:hypothetical protein